MHRALATTGLTLLTVLALGGCASGPSTEASMGQMDPLHGSRHGVVTLGAGDALGSAIHTNNVVLAALREAETAERITGAQPLDEAGLMLE